MKHKYLSLAIFTCIIYVQAFSQQVLGPQKTIGGSDYDDLQKLCLTKDGGYIAGGRSYSNASGEKSENSRGSEDYWVVKFNSNGKIQWQKTIGGDGDDFFRSVIQTIDGGYALIGTSTSDISGEKTDYCRGLTDYWLVKLDSSGNIQWDKTYGGSDYDFIDNIVQEKDGSYILAGSSASNISGEKSEDSRGGWDYWVVKVDANGNKLWDKTIGGSDNEFCSPVKLTTDGGVIIGGFSWSNISGEKSENSRGSDDFWIVKLDKNGNIQWDKTIGGSSDDYCHAIIQTDDGGYLVGGNSASNVSGEKTANSWGGFDYWLVKLDRKGNKVWDKTIGGSYDDHDVWSLDSTLDGQGYILGGRSYSPVSGNKTEYSRGGSDYWVVKINKKGKILWNKTIGGSDDEYLQSIVEIEKNKFLLGGTSYSDISGDKTGASRGNGDYWIVTLIDRTRTSSIASLETKAVESTDSGNFAVFPNPTNSSFNITMPANNKFDKISLKVTDIAGTQIEQRQNLLPGKIIQLGSEYKAGTYFVELRQGMNVKVIKVVKQ
jgi:hypothetical protein